MIKNINASLSICLRVKMFDENNQPYTVKVTSDNLSFRKIPLRSIMIINHTLTIMCNNINNQLDLYNYNE